MWGESSPILERGDFRAMWKFLENEKTIGENLHINTKNVALSEY